MAKTLHVNKPLTEEQINHCRMMTMKAYYEHYAHRGSYGISSSSKLKGGDSSAAQKRNESVGHE